MQYTRKPESAGQCATRAWRRPLPCRDARPVIMDASRPFWKGLMCGSQLCSCEAFEDRECCSWRGLQPFSYVQTKSLSSLALIWNQDESRHKTAYLSSEKLRHTEYSLHLKQLNCLRLYIYIYTHTLTHASTVHPVACSPQHILKPLLF